MGARYIRGVAILATALTALPAWADEIHLKDGKKLYGVIVAYEENMFKVKTDFGYVLVEKDKIASIIPSTPTKPAGRAEQPAAKSDVAKPAPESGNASVTDARASVSANPGSKTATADATNKLEKLAPKITNIAVKPELPAIRSVNADAPAIKGGHADTTTALAVNTASPAPPKEAEPSPIREEVQKNLYTNYTHGFRMYKAPSWELIDDARNALPNAIVAMGTPNESTLLVVVREKTKEPLEAAAPVVERRLREVYENYRQVSGRKTTAGRSPAMEFHFRGLADGHDWSGTLVVGARGTDIFTVLGMTYADSDLIQIQENVIAKAITSLDFNVH
jgi:hypothetical protein